MKTYLFTALICLGAFTACHEQDKEVVITETRRVTSLDKIPKLDATSTERFTNAKPSPYLSETPSGWNELPGTRFRLMNYRFGESGKGEVYLSVSRGSVLDNVNRWLGQFGKTPLEENELQKLKQTTLLSNLALIVEADGRFAGGMGKAPEEDFALYGIIGQDGDQIITVKMMGPKSEVEQFKASAHEWAQSLQHK